MSGQTATWRQPVHSTFTLTVSKQVCRLPSDQDSPMRTRKLYTTRAVATQHRRVRVQRERRSFPGKRYVLIGPASVSDYPPPSPLPPVTVDETAGSSLARPSVRTSRLSTRSAPAGVDRGGRSAVGRPKWTRVSGKMGSLEFGRLQGKGGLAAVGLDWGGRP
eukprot:6941216-Prymnesium_polylepis.1